MKYANIAKTLGWAETPDVEEGLFLQPEEATALDEALEFDEDNSAINANLTAENVRLTGELSTATTSLTAANNRITALEEENRTLGGQSSGTGTGLPTGEDERTPETGANKKVGLNDPSHPLNVEAARIVEAKKASDKRFKKLSKKK